jgi:ATP-GRASP peptide maturase of grasp-with-spasm system
MLQLRFAEQVGLEVPPYLLSGERGAVLAFQEKHRDIITKVIDAPIFFLSEETSLPTYTTKVEREHILNLPENFSPSIFQKMIPKKCEIRSFYMDDTFYSMAIFSQTDDQTKVDFRKYNWKKPNRNVPFQLPESVQDQLRALMRKLDMHSGSFDIILTPEGAYVFLEVNPVGQFGMVSIPCNYYLEKKIAEFLSRNH